MPDVVLPALDEAPAIPSVLASLPSDYDPIVVDNGSVDGTASVARRLGAQVVVEPRRGFGAACFAGLLAATADVVCFMDCDGSLDGARSPTRRRTRDGRTALISCSAHAAPRRARGRCTPAGRTARSPSRFVGARRFASATSDPCGRRRARSSWPSGSSTADSDGRSRWSCARGRTAGASKRSTFPTRLGSGARR